MPRPKSNKTPAFIPVAELDYQWQITVEAMKKLRLEVLGFEVNPHRSNIIMCFFKEMQAKMELLNGA